MSDYDQDEYEVTFDCANCGEEVDTEQFNRTGVDEFCENCDLPCSDPRSHTFGNCGCDEEEL